MKQEPCPEEIDEWLQTQAKAMVAYAFRNTFLEDIHAGKACPTCQGKQEYSHITNEDMRKLMKESVNKIYTDLKLQWNNYDAFMNFINFNSTFAEKWDKPEIEAKEYELFLKNTLF